MLSVRNRQTFMVVFDRSLGYMSFRTYKHYYHVGDDKESSCIYSNASSTIQLTAHEYAFKLRQLAEKVNVGECLWQIRAQALSQEVGLYII